VTFDDHNQARLPMILLSIQDGKPTIEGAERADIEYPKTN
jgi:branched-chain amino acid transport system substrate-binding protein